jgi:hypothetical protein
MSKEKINYATLNSSDRARIARAVNAAVVEVGSSGTILARICSVAQEAAKGAPISSETLDAIMADVKRSDGVQALAPRTRDNVLSRYRTTLMVYDRLSDAIEAVKDSAGSITVHDAFALASLLRKGKSIKDAAKMVSDKIRGKRAEPTKADYAKRAASALKAWFENSRGEKRVAILKAAESLGLKIA